MSRCPGDPAHLMSSFSVEGVNLALADAVDLADAAPMLLASAGDDVQVHAHNAINLTARLRAAGGRVLHEGYPRLSHENVVMALSKPFSGKGPVLDHVVAFLDHEMSPHRSFR